MKKLLATGLVFAMALSMCNISALAVPATQYAADGTLILDKYPDMPGVAEKQAMATIYSEYLKGGATKSEVSNCPVLMISACPEEVIGEVPKEFYREVLAKPIDLEGLVEQIKFYA